jgi:hypothetical protein
MRQMSYIDSLVFLLVLCSFPNSQRGKEHERVMGPPPGGGPHNVPISDKWGAFFLAAFLTTKKRRCSHLMKNDSK